MIHARAFCTVHKNGRDASYPRQQRPPVRPSVSYTLAAHRTATNKLATYILYNQYGSNSTVHRAQTDSIINSGEHDIIVKHRQHSIM